MNRALILVAALTSAAFPLLLDSAWKGTVLIIVAWLVAAASRRASAATRHLIWLFTLAALLALPVLSALLPAWRALPHLAPVSQLALPYPPPTTEPRSATSGQSDAAINLSTDSSTAALSTETSGSLRNEVLRPGLRDWLTLAWVSGFVLLVGRLFAAQWLLRHATRRGTATESGLLITALEEARQQLQLRQPVQLLIDSDRTIPMVWGVFRARLLLPSEATDWDPTRLRSVFLHELAHVKRRDTATQWVVQLVCALYWFHPLVWLAARQLRAGSERACDDMVLTSGVRASDYARDLVHVATNLSSVKGQACGLAMARQSRLEGRLRAVLDLRANRGRATRLLAGVTLAAVFGTAVPLAMLRVAESSSRAAQAAEPDQSKKKPSEYSSLPLEPWKATGRVTDTNGNPMADVEIWVHAGMGSLRFVGEGKTDADGRYTVSFGRGMSSPIGTPNLQFANVTAHKPGFFETNLNRHGGRAGALMEVSTEDLEGYKITPEQLFLPDRPQTINFVMAPAARVKGRLLGTGLFRNFPPHAYRVRKDEPQPSDDLFKFERTPLRGWKVWLTGKQLPPACSVIDSGETDANGEFIFEDVPTGFEWEFQFDTHREQKEPKSPPFKLEQPGGAIFELEFPEDQKSVRLSRMP